MTTWFLLKCPSFSLSIKEWRMILLKRVWLRARITTSDYIWNFFNLSVESISSYLSLTDRADQLNCTFSENWFKFVLSYQRLVWCCQAALCIYHQRNNRYQQELEWKAVDWGGEGSSKKFFFLLLFFFLTNARTQEMNQSFWSLDVPEQTVRATLSYAGIL